jgi:hypothetical protein
VIETARRGLRRFTVAHGWFATAALEANAQTLFI